MKNLSKVKFKQILNTISISMRIKKSLVICSVVLIVMYLMFGSSIRWSLFESVSSLESELKQQNSLKSTKYIPLPNLIQRPIIIDNSNIISITANNLTKVINQSKKSILTVFTLILK